MGKFGRQPINDASKPRPQLAYLVGGEQRIERRPSGKVEQFVDLQGNVVNLQLVSLGDSNPGVAEKNRARYRKDGFVEYAQCPLRSGARFDSPAIEKDFEEMPNSIAHACANHPKVFEKTATGIEPRPPCAHIQWLLESRRTKEKLAYATRNAQRIAKENQEAEQNELRSVQLEMAKEELENKRASRRKAPRPES